MRSSGIAHESNLGQDRRRRGRPVRDAVHARQDIPSAPRGTRARGHRRRRPCRGRHRRRAHRGLRRADLLRGRRPQRGALRVHGTAPAVHLQRRPRDPGVREDGGDRSDRDHERSVPHRAAGLRRADRLARIAPRRRREDGELRPPRLRVALRGLDPGVLRAHRTAAHARVRHHAGAARPGGGHHAPACRAQSRGPVPGADFGG